MIYLPAFTRKINQIKVNILVPWILKGIIAIVIIIIVIVPVFLLAVMKIHCLPNKRKAKMQRFGKFPDLLFLPYSWKWKITLNERKLILEIHPFPLNHDCDKHYHFVAAWTSFWRAFSWPQLCPNTYTESLIHLSNEKRAPSCLEYIWDYTTQLNADYNKH